MKTDPVLKAHDVAPFACRGGIKRFCEASGLDYAIFLKEGYPLSKLRAVGCAVANAAFDKTIAAQTEVFNGQQQ